MKNCLVNKQWIFSMAIWSTVKSYVTEEKSWPKFRWKLNGVQQLRWSDDQTLLPDKKPKTQESLQTTTSQMNPKARFFWGPQFIRKIWRDALQKRRGRQRLLVNHFCLHDAPKKNYCSAVYFRKLIFQAEGKLKYWNAWNGLHSLVLNF